MNFGLAFSFLFQDKDWLKKIAIPAVCLLIPIVGQFVMIGWALEIARRVIQRDPEAVPNLEFGKNLVTGLIAWVITFVYNLPTMILYLPSALIMPIGEAAGMDADTLSTVYLAVTACCGCLTLIYGIFASFMVPAALGKYLAEGSFGAAFKFGEVFGLVKAAPVAYLLVLAGALIMGFIAPLGIIVCVIGVIFTAAYGYAIYAHLLGQAYNTAKEKAF